MQLDIRKLDVRGGTQFGRNTSSDYDNSYPWPGGMRSGYNDKSERIPTEPMFRKLISDSVRCKRPVFKEYFKTMNLTVVNCIHVKSYVHLSILIYNFNL